MKKYLEIKKQPLPYHVERSFFKALKRSAKEHGFKGAFPRFRFLMARLFDHFLQVVSRVMPFSSFRAGMQRARGVTIGKNTHIGPMVTIDDVYPYFVIIGDNVSIAGQNFILTHSKPLKYHKEVSEAYVAPVIIEDNVWVAINVTILPGVRIGEGSIIAAGSVVTKDIPPFVFAAGIPAKPIKDISEKLRHNYSKEKFEKIMKKREKSGFKV